MCLLWLIFRYLTACRQVSLFKYDLSRVLQLLISYFLLILKKRTLSPFSKVSESFAFLKIPPAKEIKSNYQNSSFIKLL